MGDALSRNLKSSRNAQVDGADPVLLVIRTSDGEIRWMDVSDDLKRECHSGKKTIKQNFFVGERFDVMSVHLRRDKALNQKKTE